MRYNRKLFILFLAASTFCIPQAKAQSNARVGIKGGLNASNFYSDDVTDKNARLGFHVGVFGQLFSSRLFAIQPELLYSTKGTLARYGNPVNQEIKFNLSYIDLPVLAVIKLANTVEIHLGAYASYLVDANISYKGDLVNGVDRIDKDNLKSYDYGLVGGLGLSFGAIQFGGRYNFGLLNVASSNSARKVLGDAKNSCAQLFLALNLTR